MADLAVARPTPPDFGEPARSFTSLTDGVPNYTLDVAAGRFMVLMMFGTLRVELCQKAHDAVIAQAHLFDDANAVFFGVTVDPDDRNARNLHNEPVGIRYLWDLERKAFALYGLIDEVNLQPAIFLIDRSFRILMAEDIIETPKVLKRLEAELQAEEGHQAAPFAPVLVLPNIFEPEFCTQLVDYFNHGEISESGFAASVGGRTLTVINSTLKRRQDVTIVDEDLVQGVKDRIEKRLFPLIKRAFNWQPTRIERYLICRYSSDDNGFFLAHRDDVLPGAEHRKFAVSINLSPEPFEGGAVRFPEFGLREYVPPVGGAVVFSCNLLHEVMPVTRGERFVLVPFLFDEVGEVVRLTNLTHVGPLA